MTQSPVVVAGVTSTYPSAAVPASGTFVQALFKAMRAQGAVTRLVAPYSRSRDLLERFRRGPANGAWPAGDDSGVRRPGYWSLPGALIPGTNLGLRVTMSQFRGAVRRELPLAAGGATFIYCHFYTAGWAALSVGEQLKLPVILAFGESVPGYYDRILGRSEFDRTLSRFAGIIAVSRQNEAFCRERVPGIGSRLRYLPNGADLALFTPRGRLAARARLGLPSHGNLVVFAGHFTERKGPLRVVQALKQLDGALGVFLGDGSQVPRGPGVTHAGPVPHQEMPWWLSAADVFVLPSLAEGMSNATVEALACGLPVVVSDRPFNREFLDSSCAEFVDPESPAAIARGLATVLDNPVRREEMALAARRVAERLGLEDRARAILAFGCEMASGSDPHSLTG